MAEFDESAVGCGMKGTPWPPAIAKIAKVGSRWH
jgi:hypothetical protein